MTRFDPRSIRKAIALAALVAIVPLAGQAGDEDIFSANVPPNVLLMMDNSGSLNAILEHSSFDPASFTYTCDIMPATGTGTINLNDELGRPTRRACASSGCRFEVHSSDAGWVATPDPTDDPQHGWIERRFCGQTRRLYTDGINQDFGNRTWYYSEYVEWLFSMDASDTTTLIGPPGRQMTAPAILAEIDDGANGRNYIDGDLFGKYQITRMTAARDIARDVIYQTNSDCPAFAGDCGVYEDRVRFGIAKFQASAHGGYVAAAIAPYSTNRIALQNAINALDAETATPLGETLFKLYTYFMSRNTTHIPYGQDGATKFPAYTYRMSDGAHTTTASQIAADPITEVCQKNFIIIVTDGEPTNDTFDLSGTNTNGFSNFMSLIGDYAPDAVGDLDIGTDATPEVGMPPWGSPSGAGWLDDIALFMQENDCRLDHPGTQFVDVYTVGFSTGEPANTLLRKTAANGNGLFFSGNQAEALTQALVSSIQDIISKAQGFSAATVPAARTADGGQLYTTLFQPTNARPFWPGLLRSYKITADGQILDANGACALENLADPSFCAQGTFKSEATAPPFWNASKEMPDANDRNLKISLTGLAAGVETFDHAIEESDLGGALGTIAMYPPSPNVTSAADLDEALVAFLAGCEWGTGMTSSGSNKFAGCVERTQVVNGLTQSDKLGDIFHSNPVVVGPPSAYIPEFSYLAFATKANLVHRDRVIIAGANDGFLHGFHAGEWVASPAPARYDEGTGEEVFGFMPWGARAKVMNLAKSDATLHPLTVDGSPSVADVWIDGDSNPTNGKDPAGDEWRTVLVTGLREGGEHYLALDVTDPASSGYPQYMWEFPAEGDSGWRAYVGQTWSQPVITRVRLETGSGVPVEKWVAVIGFGYDPTSDPNNGALYDAASTKGRGVAMLDIATGAPIAVRKFGAGTGDVSDMVFAIASSPGVLDYDQDGFADLIYIGDLGGNVWKWIIRARGIDSPSASNLHQPNWPFRKFFSDDPSRSSGHARSFYFAPAATRVNSILHLGIGSGERSDLNCSSTLRGCTLLNRYYVLKDRDVWDSGTLSTIDGREQPTGDLTNVTALEDSCPGVMPRGFFFEVADGEKFVTNSEVFNAFFFASTFTPDLSNVCEPSGLSSLYGFLAKCGQGFFGPPSPSSPIAGIARSLDLGKGMPTDARLSIAPGSGGNRLIISKQDGELININSGNANSEHGTLYWREID